MKNVELIIQDVLRTHFIQMFYNTDLSDIKLTIRFIKEKKITNDNVWN